MVRLIPRDEAFRSVFVKDGENLLEAARALNAMFTEFDRLDERVATIQALEHAGDEIDAEIAARLEKSFITPFDREDIHELYTRLDDVVDGIQEAAETVVIYGIDSAPAEARRMAGIIAAQAEQLLEALRKLDHLEKAGMHLKAIHDLENEADGLSRSAIGRLFRDGDDALTVIKLRDLYKVLEETVDAAEDAAEVIERIAAKHQ
jgi:predicted phosphate transport protein (TIGR00153 family)